MVQGVTGISPITNDFHRLQNYVLPCWLRSSDGTKATAKTAVVLFALLIGCLCNLKIVTWNNCCSQGERREFTRTRRSVLSFPYTVEYLITHKNSS